MADVSAFHVITGAPGGELQRDGDTLPDDERYERTGEYIDVLRKVWSTDKPFDHQGHYYTIPPGVQQHSPPAKRR